MRLKAGATFQWLAPAALVICGAGQATTVEADPLQQCSTPPLRSTRFIARTGCRLRQCQAMADMVQPMALSLQRDRPNGNVLLDPGKFDPFAYDHKIDSIVRAHPQGMITTLSSKRWRDITTATRIFQPWPGVWIWRRVLILEPVAAFLGWFRHSRPRLRPSIWSRLWKTRAALRRSGMLARS